MRIDGREPNEIRPCTIQTGFVETADGSCLISTGRTRVICTASVDESVPPFLMGKGKGWITAEYAMLPASTVTRKARDGIKKDGRSVEIQRLIGRSLRQAVNLDLLGERTITLDCDVLQADGGTRTASITGAYVALVLAIHKLLKSGILTQNPIVTQVAAVSVGLLNDQPLLDFCYREDSYAQTDMNLVMNQKGEFIELQGTGEGRPFATPELKKLLNLGRSGIRSLMKCQRDALAEACGYLLPKPSIVIASGNEHKITEMRKIFGRPYEFVSMKEAGFDGDIAENGTTFEENAAIKAETVAKELGLPVLADDSGLCVDALGGAPGVFSARYAGEHGNTDANNALLLKNMENEKNRACRFVCAMALALPGESTRIVQGECEGELLRAPQGEGGFGYDPLFLYGGRSFGEMNESAKNKVSHRAKAAEAMQTVLREVFG